MLGKKKSPKEELDYLFKKPTSKKSIKDYQRTIDILYKELQRRDKIIDKLKEEKEILFKASIRTSERLNDFQRIKENKKE